MKTEPIYELLKFYADPCGSVDMGTRKTEGQWMARFSLLNYGDCEIKTDWFKPVQVPTYNTGDMIEFADYIQNLLPRNRITVHSSVAGIRDLTTSEILDRWNRLRKI